MFVSGYSKDSDSYLLLFTILEQMHQSEGVLLCIYGQMAVFVQHNRLTSIRPH